MPRVAKKSLDIGREMEYMLATGNLRSRSGLGLQQVHQVGTKRQWTAPIDFQLRDMLCSILPESVVKCVYFLVEFGVHDCGREAQLLPLPVSLQSSAQRSLLHRDEDHQRQEAAPRSLG